MFTPRWGAELLWTEQGSALRLGTDAGAADLFTMTIRQLQGNVLYHFGDWDAKLQPFVFGGMGATYFSADDLESETKFSFGLGGGVKYFPWNAIGARAHFRYTPTLLNDEEAAASATRSGSVKARCSRSNSPWGPWSGSRTRGRYVHIKKASRVDALTVLEAKRKARTRACSCCASAAMERLRTALGYTVNCNAVGNTLLTIWGMVIIMLLS